MLPFYTSEQIKKADQYTIEKTPISSYKLVKQAMQNLYNHMEKNDYLQHPTYHILCGTGNNGADGLALALILAKDKNKKIRVSVLDFNENYSNEFNLYLKEVKNESLISLTIHRSLDSFELQTDSVIIDAIFGNGISRPISGIYHKTITYINQCNATIYSIDMPSGLFSNSDKNQGLFIQSKITFVLGYPRKSLINPLNKIVFELVPIGLKRSFEKTTESTIFAIDDKDIQKPTKQNFSHKYTYGHVGIIGGSEGMYGAPVLSGIAALKMGAGLTTCIVPFEGLQSVYMHLPESLTKALGKKYIEGILENSNIYEVIAIGMGMGTTKVSNEFLLRLCSDYKGKLLIDADALNIIALNKYISLIPRGSILTPHPKEFERLVGSWESEEIRLEKLSNLAKQIQGTVVLKGTYTLIADEEGNCYVNTIQASSLATAGSGDVLAGMIAALWSQGYSRLNACITGVSLHALCAKKFKGKPIIAREIIAEIANVL